MGRGRPLNKRGQVSTTEKSTFRKNAPVRGVCKFRAWLKKKAKRHPVFKGALSQVTDWM